ncbi:MAG: creatininase family protein [Bacteroidales bacterium]|nr:creatininase family protein [Bacteroidales bacterium]
MHKPLEEMRPREAMQALKQCPMAYVPVSPAIEWHSYHLPLGTDAIISEELCKEISALKGGIYTKALSLGLDAYRNTAEKEMWGLPANAEIYGMNFPHLPVATEYCLQHEFKLLVTNRIKALKASGARYIVLVNHHGGLGQFDVLDTIAKQQTNSAAKVLSYKTYMFNDLTRADGWSHEGGHAGYSETHWLMAFRPELVDTKELPDGELLVAQYGILHDKNVIEPEWNPKKTSITIAKKLRERVLKNFSAEIDSLLSINQP